MLFVLLSGCPFATLPGGPGGNPGDDDDVAADDDDAANDDDAADDDDAANDDDAADDDDSTPGVCAALVIDCTSGSAHSGNNGGPGSTDALDYNSCYGGEISGPEVSYSFTAPYDGAFHFQLSGLSEDIDLYALSGTECDSANCEEGSFAGGVDDEEVWLEASAGDEYVIVVDGFDGGVSDYVLELDCEAGGDDDDAVGDDDDVIGDDDDVGVDCTTATYDAHTYAFCDFVDLSWAAAEGDCFTRGLALVTIDDEDENDFIAATAASDGWWIGFHQPQPWNEGDFEWTGTPSTTGYTNWASGEPNDWGSWPGEDCALVADSVSWQWNDLDCDAARSWICESN